MGVSGLSGERETPQKPYLHLKLYQIKQETWYTVPQHYHIWISTYIYILTIHGPRMKPILPAVQKPLCSFPVCRAPQREGKGKAIAPKGDTSDEKKKKLLRCLRNERVGILESEDPGLVHKASWHQSSNLQSLSLCFWSLNGIMIILQESDKIVYIWKNVSHYRFNLNTCK